MVTERYQSALVVSECRECGATFSMSEGEIEWYEKKDWPPPKRCPECRKTRRESRSKLCDRCGVKPVYHPSASYCRECEDRLDKGPVYRTVEAERTAKKRREYRANCLGVTDPRD